MDFMEKVMYGYVERTLSRDGKYSYVIGENGELLLTGCLREQENVVVEIPEMVDGMPVAALINVCCGAGTGVVRIPACVKHVSPEAFDDLCICEISVDPKNEHYCSVDGVLMSKDRKRICCWPPMKPFDEALMEGVEVIGPWAMAEVEGDRLFVPETLKEIGDCAFWCAGFSETVIPASVETMGRAAFIGCWNLKKLSMAGSVKAFDGMESDDPDNDMGFFEGCGLAEFSVPEGVERIGLKAFAACRQMERVFIPASVREIDDTAFDECPAEIIVDGRNPWFESVDGALCRKRPAGNGH